MRVPTPARALPRTLRGRLIAGLLVLLTVACATVGLVTYLAVQNSLARELNNNLQTATGLAYDCFDPNGGVGIARPPGPADPAGTGHPSPASTPPPAGANPIPGNLSMCQGLAAGTFVAIVGHQRATAKVVDDTSYRLTAADERTLRTITPWPAPHPGSAPGSQGFQTTTRELSGAGGTFVLTAVSDPDGDGVVYITGLPLSQLHDLLRVVALVEAAVFGAVLLLAGAGGTLWVRFSLRPLRRVAATASQVADLPLETDEVELPAGVPDTDPATETGQVGLAFNRMLGHVQTALRRRAASEARLRRFAADASHELRTPLSAIRGYAELALRHPGDSPEQVTHALGRVLSESTRMSVLVDELLLLARLDAGRPLASEPVDVTRLVIDATSDAQVARPRHRWVLELPDDPLLVSGDEHRLHQVLANVLSNAAKHTPDGTTVTVRVGDALPDHGALPDGGTVPDGGTPPGDALGDVGTLPGGDTLPDAGGALPDAVGAAAGQTVRRGVLPPPPRLVVSVTDDGPGIPPDLLPDLFERFTRADTSRSHPANASSTGLGLAIVDAVVAAHGGAVLVTSRPGLTRFAIALPRLTEPARPQPPAAPAQHRRPLPIRKP
jgi:two-component system OmpR family sensor kinase